MQDAHVACSIDHCTIGPRDCVSRVRRVHILLSLQSLDLCLVFYQDFCGDGSRSYPPRICIFHSNSLPDVFQMESQCRQRKIQISDGLMPVSCVLAYCHTVPHSCRRNPCYLQNECNGTKTAAKPFLFAYRAPPWLSSLGL